MHLALAQSRSRSVWSDSPASRYRFQRPCSEARVMNGGDEWIKEGFEEVEPPPNNGNGQREEPNQPGTPADGGHHERQYELVWAKDVVPRAKDWLWKGHLLRGAMELLTGIPGLGKSQV